MLIIFGTRYVSTILKTGTFICPNCRAEKPWTFNRRRKFFTLFFIPLIPLNDTDDAIQCQSCRKEYVPGSILPADEYVSAQSLTVIGNKGQNLVVASPLKRFGAYFVDMLLLGGLNFPLALLIGVLPEKAQEFFGHRFPLLFLPVWILYFALMEYFAGGTIGKKLLAIKTIKDGNKGKVSIISMICRSIIKIIPVLPVVLLFTKNNKAVHDFAAGTIVTQRM